MFIKNGSLGGIGRVSTAMSLVVLGLAGSMFALQPAGAMPCNEISSLPVTIEESGDWCVTKDLFLNNADRPAIEVLADNVRLNLGGHTIKGSFKRCNLNLFLPVGSGDSRRVGVKAGALRKPVKNFSITNGTIESFAYGVEAFSKNFSIRYIDVFRSARVGIYARGNGEVKSNRIRRTGGMQCGTRAIGVRMFEDGTSNGLFFTGNLVSNTWGDYFAQGFASYGRLYAASNYILNSTSEGMVVATKSGFTRLHSNRVENTSKYYSGIGSTTRRGRDGITLFIPRDRIQPTSMAYSRNHVFGYDNGFNIGFHGDYYDLGGNVVH